MACSSTRGTGDWTHQRCRCCETRSLTGSFLPFARTRAWTWTCVARRNPEAGSQHSHPYPTPLARWNGTVTQVKGSPHFSSAVRASRNASAVCRKGWNMLGLRQARSMSKASDSRSTTPLYVMYLSDVHMSTNQASSPCRHRGITGGRRRNGHDWGGGQSCATRTVEECLRTDCPRPACHRWECVSAAATPRVGLQ